MMSIAIRLLCANRLKQLTHHAEQRQQYTERKSGQSYRGSRGLRGYSGNCTRRGNCWHHHENFGDITRIGGRQDCFRSRQGIRRNVRRAWVKVGSLSKAAAQLEMSYMKAWCLAKMMNENF